MPSSSKKVVCENCDEGVLQEVAPDGEVMGYMCERAGSFEEGVGCNILVKPDEYESLKEDQAATKMAKTRPTAVLAVAKPDLCAGDVVVKRQALMPSLSIKGAETLQLHRRMFKPPDQDMKVVAQLGLEVRKRGKLGVRGWKMITSGKFFQVTPVIPDIPIPLPVELPPLPPPVIIPPKPEPPKVLDLVKDETQRLILWEPTPEELKNDPTLATIEVENLLCKWLRPHQREGVRFMAECVLSQRDFTGAGVILADDMGLGKTLQSIALLYTLLRQGFQKNNPIVKKAIIVCPVSLVTNWRNEMTKFVQDRITTFAITDPTKDAVEKGVKTFYDPHARINVLILSYDCIRRNTEKFKRADACDLMICDEAHRLKNAKTSTYVNLHSIPCKRRVLLSGTPMQNDLDEFFAMVNFTNENVLGDRRVFKRYYEQPILAGREPDATDEESSLGIERSSELSAIVNQFILRRTNVIMQKHLPPKVTQIVCCSMTPLQIKLYKHLIGCKDLKTVLADGRKGAQVLPLMNNLKQLCNHPKLILDGMRRAKEEGKPFIGFQGCEKEFTPEFLANPADSKHSGKMLVLDQLMRKVRATTDDRWVLISNYTQTLDLMAELCKLRNWGFVRLDGSVSIKKRQQMVDMLGDRKNNIYVFLLSSKAGGCGLNLIGANRLVLFDPDWNPAVDKQAAARVWRDGQTKRCFQYRFLVTGSIEEKVYQRQLAKEGLQGVLGGAAEDANVSVDELRRLFTYAGDMTRSDTHDTIDCDCLQGKENLAPPPSGCCLKQRGSPGEEALVNWAHHTSSATTPDFHFRGSQGPNDFVTFVFSCELLARPISGPEEDRAKAVTCMGEEPPTVADSNAGKVIVSVADAQAKLASHLEQQASRRKRGGNNSDSEGEGGDLGQRRSGRSRKAPNRFAEGGDLDDETAALIRRLTEEDEAAGRPKRNAKKKKVEEEPESEEESTDKSSTEDEKEDEPQLDDEEESKKEPEKDEDGGESPLAPTRIIIRKKPGKNQPAVRVVVEEKVQKSEEPSRPAKKKTIVYDDAEDFD